jgi:hypothetical protein
MKISVTLESVCRPSEDVVAREIEGEMIIVPLAAGIGDADDELYTLNDTGREIWHALDGQRTLGQVAEVMAGAFDSRPEEIAADVLGFATEMVRRRMLTVCG